MVRQLRTAVAAVVLLTLLLGLVYPLVVTGVAQAAFAGKANGSLIKRDGKVVGSSLIGQTFSTAGYFHPRPSAAGDGYDASSSAAGNLGPTNEDLLTTIAARTEVYRMENGLRAGVEIPNDAVTASASGLDPQISVANARLQAQRIATQRGLSIDTVNKLIDRHTKGRSLGFLGDPGVDVLQLNLALDAPN
jgi:K+-transporting ATPase ATPase C chain